MTIKKQLPVLSILSLLSTVVLFSIACEQYNPSKPSVEPTPAPTADLELRLYPVGDAPSATPTTCLEEHSAYSIGLTFDDESGFQDLPTEGTVELCCQISSVAGITLRCDNAMSVTREGNRVWFYPGSLPGNICGGECSCFVRGTFGGQKFETPKEFRVDDECG